MSAGSAQAAPATLLDTPNALSLLSVDVYPYAVVEGDLLIAVAFSFIAFLVVYILLRRRIEHVRVALTMRDGRANQERRATEGVPVVLEPDATTPVRRAELRDEFPARLAALCSMLGKSDREMADAMDLDPKQFWQYRTGRRIPAGAEMLNLLRIASRVEGGMAVLMGLRPDLVEQRRERWPR